MDEDNFESMFKWLKFGIDKGWVTKPVCYMHDGVPTTSDEDDEMEEGFDPCIQVIRLWES